MKSSLFNFRLKLVLPVFVLMVGCACVEEVQGPQWRPISSRKAKVVQWGIVHNHARIIRGEIPNPPGLYNHDLIVHKVSLDACNLETEDVK